MWSREFVMAKSRWWIENGKSVKILKDRWIPRKKYLTSLIDFFFIRV